MFLETHRSQDGRFSLGFDPPSIFLFDHAAPHRQPIRVWPYDEASYTEAIAFASGVGGPLHELPPPSERRPQPHPINYAPMSTRSRWTSWFLAPIIGGGIGLILWFSEADNAHVCESGTGTFARALSAQANRECTADLAVHRLGLILMIGAAVWAGILLFLRRPQ